MDNHYFTQDNEKGLLAAMIADNSIIGDVESILKPEDFHFENHRTIFSSIVYQFACGRGIDPLTLISFLRESGKLEFCGGVSYISELTDALPDIGNALFYAEQVKKLSISRTLSSLSKRIEHELETSSPLDVIDNSLSTLIKLSESATDSNQVSVGDVMNSEVDYLLSLTEGGEREQVTLTGFNQVDLLLGGLKPGEMYTIAARPSIGKTAFATNIATNIAKQNKPVMFFSLEMGRKQLIRRVLSSETGIPYRMLEIGYLKDEQKDRLRAARDRMRTVPLIIDDNSTQTLAGIRTKARRQMARSGLSLIIVDYLQMACKRDDYEEISAWSRGLRSIGKDLGVAIMPISQLSRQIEYRDNSTPMLADLRGSGQIEQDSDVVAFLWHKETKNKLRTTLTVAKHRNGPLGDVEFDFHNATTLFEEIGLEVE